MKEKLMSILKSPRTYIILIIGMILALAYRRYLSGTIGKVASYLPMSDAKAAAAA